MIATFYFTSHSIINSLLSSLPLFSYAALCAFLSHIPILTSPLPRDALLSPLLSYLFFLPFLPFVLFPLSPYPIYPFISFLIFPSRFFPQPNYFHTFCLLFPPFLSLPLIFSPFHFFSLLFSSLLFSSLFFSSFLFFSLLFSSLLF